MAQAWNPASEGAIWEDGRYRGGGCASCCGIGRLVNLDYFFYVRFSCFLDTTALTCSSF